MKNCIDCGKILANYKAKRCKSCASKGSLNQFFGKKHTLESKKKISNAGKGRILSLETRLKIGLSHKGEKAYQWKGNNVGYGSLHKWVRKYLGQPSQCKKCGKKGNGHQIHWANKNGKYLRNLKDWIRLCAKCHGEYDSVKGLRKNSIRR